MPQEARGHDQHRVPQLPHETWTTDNYKTLDAEAGKIVEECYGKALLELGVGWGYTSQRRLSG